MLIDRTKLFFDSTYGEIKNKCFILGVSGGPDSICLLDILSKLNYDLIVAHLDHQIRDNSESESEFVRNAARHYGFPFVTKKKNVPAEAKKRKIGIEETARILRYQFLLKTAEQKNANAVITAHQADDQVETILINMIRGSGLKGLCGMRMKDYTIYNKKIPLLRPLLTTWRDEILMYCRENDLSYVLDESNAEIKYLRNRVRNHLIPELETYNPSISKAILRMGGNLTLDQEFIRSFTDKKMSQAREKAPEESYVFRLSEFLKLEESVQLVAIKSILEEQFSDHLDITQNVIRKAQRFFTRKFRTLSLRIGRDFYLIRDSKIGVLTLNQNSLSQSIWPSCNEDLEIQKIPKTIKLNDYWSLSIRAIENPFKKDDFNITQDPNTAFVNSDQIEFPLRVRSWKPGERFTPFGLKGKSIKLSDYWINHKIPKIAREAWPLVDSGGEVIWISGIQITDRVKINRDIERVLELKLERI